MTATKINTMHAIVQRLKLLSGFVLCYVLDAAGENS